MALKMLLVEDNQDYAHAAKAYLASRNYAVEHAKDYFEAFGKLENSGGRFMGVITDLFFPRITGSKSISMGRDIVDIIVGPTPVQEIRGDGIFSPDYTTIDYNSLLMEAMEKSEANQPLGVAVAEMAKSRALAYVIATSSYHHDNLTQPFCTKGYNIVDCNPEFGESKRKRNFWEKVVEKLEAQFR